MDVALTGEQGDLVSAAREFSAARLRPHCRRRDTEGALDRATLAEMGRLGFFGLELEARAMARVCRTDDAWTGIREVAARRIPVSRPLITCPPPSRSASAAGPRRGLRRPQAVRARPGTR